MRKAKLIKNIPINPKHGAVKGAIFSIIRLKQGYGRGANIYVLMGDAGEEFSVYSREIEILEKEV